MDEQFAAVSRRNLFHLLLVRHQLELLLSLQWLLDQSHPGACPQLLAGAVVRFKFKGRYALRIVQGTFLHAGTLHLALKGLPVGVPPSRVSRFHLFGSPGEFELEGRRELEELLSTLAPHEHALRLLEVAATAWRLKVALEWAAHLEEYVPKLGLEVLLGDLRDAGRVADMAAHLDLLVPAWSLADPQLKQEQQQQQQQQQLRPGAAGAVLAPSAALLPSQLPALPGKPPPAALPALASGNSSLQPSSLQPHSPPASDGSWEDPSDQPSQPSSSQQQRRRQQRQQQQRRQQEQVPVSAESAGECSLPSYVARDAEDCLGSRAEGPGQNKDGGDGEVVGATVAGQALQGQRGSGSSQNLVTQQQEQQLGAPQLQQQQGQPRGQPPGRDAASPPSSGQLTGFGAGSCPGEERRAAASSAGVKRPMQASSAAPGKQQPGASSAAHREAKESPGSRKKQRGEEGRSKGSGSREDKPLWVDSKKVEPWVAKLLFRALRACVRETGVPFQVGAVGSQMKKLDGRFVAKVDLPCKMSNILKALETKGLIKVSWDGKNNPWVDSVSC